MNYSNADPTPNYRGSGQTVSKQGIGWLADGR